MSKLHDRPSKSVARASSAQRSEVAPRPLPTSTQQPGGDPLSDLLRTVRLSGALFFVWEVSFPYAMPIPGGEAFAPTLLPGAQQIISYHIVTHGFCFGAVPGKAPFRLEAGDVLLVPHGDPYVMASSARGCAAARLELAPALAFFRQMAADARPSVVREGGGGKEFTRVVCGFLGCDLRPFNPALAALPTLVHLRRPAQARARERLEALIEITLAEVHEPAPGGQSVLLRLGELMFLEVLRRCLTELPNRDRGWLTGLRDPLVGRALWLLHRDPARAWTLAELASELGVSRSNLAQCFTRMVGEPPMHYLSRWRIQLATRLLSESAAKMATIAHDVGYGSEAAFSRAFKRCVGVAPAVWRAARQTR
jgi:AraC-like DNA-binding protein